MKFSGGENNTLKLDSMTTTATNTSNNLKANALTLENTSLNLKSYSDNGAITINSSINGGNISTESQAYTLKATNSTINLLDNLTLASSTSGASANLDSKQKGAHFSNSTLNIATDKKFASDTLTTQDNSVIVISTDIANNTAGFIQITKANTTKDDLTINIEDQFVKDIKSGKKSLEEGQTAKFTYTDKKLLTDGIKEYTLGIASKGFDLEDTRYMTAYETSQEADSNNLSLDSLTIKRSKEGKKGDDGLSFDEANINILSHDNKSVRASTIGSNAGDGKDGTNAILYGNGGNGGHGGKGESLFQVAYRLSGSSLFSIFDKNANIDAIGGNGGNGANGAMADGIDHFNGVKAGDGGNGGAGGDVYIAGIYANGLNGNQAYNLTLNGKLDLKATGGKGGTGGKKGDHTKADTEDGSFTLIDDKFADGVANEGKDGEDAKDGDAVIYGVYLDNGSKLNLTSKDGFTMNASANSGTGKAEVYGVYINNGSHLTFKSDKDFIINASASGADGSRASAFYIKDSFLTIDGNVNIQTTTTNKANDNTSGAIFNNAHIDFNKNSSETDKFHKFQTNDSVVLEKDNTMIFNINHTTGKADILNANEFKSDGKGKLYVSIRDPYINKKLEEEKLQSGSFEFNNGGITLIKGENGTLKDVEIASSGSGGSYDTQNRRYGVELFFNDYKNEGDLKVTKVEIVENHHGKDGKDGKSYNYKTLMHIGDAGVFTKTGQSGTNGEAGTNAYLYGNGGDGGFGGHGEGFRVFGFNNANNASISKDMQISITAGDGGNGADGGLGDGADHKYNQGSTNKITSGDGGAGGRGGDAIAIAAFSSKASSNINLDANINIKTKSGKGGQAGTVGNIHNATIINKDSKYTQSAWGTQYLDGLDGASYALGLVAINGGVLNITSSNDSVKNIHVESSTNADDKSKLVAYSLYASNNSLISVGTSLNLSAKVEQGSGDNNSSKAYGAYLENSKLYFGALEENKLKSMQDYRKISTDKFTLKGDATFGFYTDLKNNKGDSIEITKELDFSDIKNFKIEILDDAGIFFTYENPISQTITGDHTLVDLSQITDKNKFKLEGYLQASNTTVTKDQGAIRYYITPTITQDDKTGNIDLEKIEVVNKNYGGGGGDNGVIQDPSEIIRAITDSGFLVNRMHLLSRNDLSERFRILKDNNQNYGMWVQGANNHLNLHSSAYGDRKISSIYTSSKYGFDEKKSFKNFDMMNGVYAGYARLSSDLNSLGSSKINNFSTGFYSAFMFHDDSYIETGFNLDHYKAKTNVSTAFINDPRYNGGDINSNYSQFAYSAFAALGKKFHLNKGAFLDSSIGADFTYYAKSKFKTSNKISIYNEDYRNLGLVASVLLGQYYNDEKTLVYLKTDFGKYFSDAEYGKLSDPLMGTWRYKKGDYDYSFLNAAIGFKVQAKDNLELSFETNRYFLDDTDANYGFKAEARYKF
nr:autotransporter outer membrane beta-barrel domain-containing protein [Campylobacter lari]MCR6559065.1 autotransporter outer membrane beta-barrel domain-containing protein [Campylobacter lari]